MSRKWTDAQRAAIDTHGKDLLVSAAAGSGKTATLTERIITSLTDKSAPADISNMLIVTFTRAAAAELRQRIFKAVSDALSETPSNRHLSSQLVKIGNAKICTIDSFYLDLIRENFSTLGLPPSFRIADTTETELLQKELMTEVVEDFYTREPKRFPLLAEAFSTLRSSHKLPDVFINLYTHIASYPEGVEFLRECAERYRAEAELDFSQSSFGKILIGETRESVEYFISVLSDAVALIDSDEEARKAYLPSFSYDLTFCRDLLDILDDGGYAQIRAHLLTYSPIKLKSLKAELTTDEVIAYKEKRKDITAAIRDLGKKSFSLTAENIAAAMLDTADHTALLYDILSDFDQRLSEEKLTRGICDFNDIRKYALKLLVAPDGSRTKIAQQLSERFTDIYIDEYQDVDRVQDMIFRAISNGANRFMVGDIKQSIYGFRGAEPHVFAGYKSSFPTHGSKEARDSANEAIHMSNNFRCDESIINFTNKVCSHLFGICAENIGYSHEDDLVFSKEPPSEDYVAPRVRLSVLTAPDGYVGKAESNRDAEANYIVGLIRELLGSKKANGRNYELKDIAVLYRSGSMKKHLIRAFDANGIEYSGGENEEYFEDPDVLLILALLSVIDNPHKDIPLAGTLRSPLFSLTLDELIKIRELKDPSYSLYDCVRVCAEQGSGELSAKCSDFLVALEEWRDMAGSFPVDKLIKSIYASSRFAAVGISDSNNLRVLYEYARKFESSSFRGLYNFIEYINKMIDEGVKIDAPAGEESSKKVALMTIHHSKGLEYPACILCGVAGEFNRSDFRDSMLFEYSAGVAMKLPDTTGFARINTPMREAIASRIMRAQTEEEMRVLYVALTRARERLYVTASSSKTKERLLDAAAEKRAYASRYVTMRSKSYLEWILTALSGEDISDICNIEFPDITRYLDVPTEENISADTSEEIAEVKPDETLLDHLRATLAYEYPYRELSRIPSKISVSRLSPDVLDENDTALNLFEEHSATAIPTVFSGVGDKKASPTQRGTATHLFLQFCDFERAEKTGAAEELARLIEKGFLPATAADEVFTEELERFFESELYAKIKSARRVIREQRFNIYLPTAMFSKDTAFIEAARDELLAVQGVIDLILIDGDGELRIYDYKTDRLSRDELESANALAKKMRALHSEQLSYYKLAAERLFDRACASVEVYSTQAAALVDIAL
ncbi:MAG: helicase-exonuclease AddAB subunit AddA [Clostridia bacterium]|nr:helicase-exonuclease AddAB subunit AddA [Clostridia bacterium]